MNPLLEAIGDERHALMPVAPRQATYPRHSADPSIQAMHEAIATLHWLGFVALYGPAPEGVTVKSVDTGIAGRPLAPRLLAVAAPDAGPEARTWLDAFGCGLDRWEEAEMATPCIFTPVAPDKLHVHMRPRHQILAGALHRLAARGRLRELRNLRSVLGLAFPKRFDPDAPAFTGARRPRRSPR